MKVGYAVPVVVLITASGMTYRWLRETRPPWAVRIWKEISLPYRLVKLQTSEPDRSIRMPVAGVPTSRVANTWQASRSGDRKHEGQDIFARRDTPVVSATDGIVIRTGENRLGGNVVVVFGPGGRRYYYAHLSRHAEALNVGDEVLRGTVIGYVGDTGNARGSPPHLHFGIYTATGAINPLPLLAD